MYDPNFPAGIMMFFLLTTIGWLILVVTFVVAVWRMMKAHESLAESVYEISEDMKMRGSEASRTLSQISPQRPDSDSTP